MTTNARSESWKGRFRARKITMSGNRRPDDLAAYDAAFDRAWIGALKEYQAMIERQATGSKPIAYVAVKTCGCVRDFLRDENDEQGRKASAEFVSNMIRAGFAIVRRDVETAATWKAFGCSCGV